MTQQLELRNLALELDEIAEDENLRLHGYVATNQSSHILGKDGGKKWREYILPGTFEKAIAKAKMSGEKINLLADHDPKQILASTVNDSLRLEEDEIGLYFEAKVSPTSYGKNLYILVRDKIIKGLSFGMKVIRDDWKMGADGLAIRTISDIELFEVSALETPAYPATLLEARGLEVAEVQVPADLEFRELLGGNGMDQEFEVTPKMLYDAIATLADHQAETNRLLKDINDKAAFDGIEMAKQVMDKVAEVAQVQNDKTREVIDKEETVKVEDDTNVEGEERALNEDEVLDEKKPGEKPGEELTEEKPGEKTEQVPADQEADKKETDPKVDQEKVDAAEDMEKRADELDETETEKAVDEVEDDEENKKEKQAIEEIRSWLTNNKITEVR